MVFLLFAKLYSVLIDQHSIRILTPAVLGHIFSMEGIASGALSVAPIEEITLHQFRDDTDPASLLAEYLTASRHFQNIRQILAQAA